MEVVEKRRRSSSDASMKEKRVKKVRAEVEAMTPMEEEGRTQRVRKAPKAIYVPEESAAPQRKKVKTRKVVAPGKRQMVVTRHTFETPITLPPLKLSPRYFEEYREPVSIPSSVSSRKSSSLKVLQIKATKTKEKDATLVNDVKKMIEDFRGLDILENADTKVPKIPRHQEALVRYDKYLNFFAENVEKKSQAILANEHIIRTMSALIENIPLATLDNIRNFKRALKTAGIANKDIKALKNLPNPSKILEDYEVIRTKILQVYDAEIKIFRDILQKYTARRIKYVNKVNDEKGDEKKVQYQYYIEYYEAVMTELTELLSTILEDKNRHIAMLDKFESTKASLIPLQEMAMTVTTAYEKATTTLQQGKTEKAKDIDDLMALFGKL